MGYVLLTGATGLLGRYLMRDLMNAGVPLAVLVRPSRRKNPYVRVEAAMRAWEQMEGRAFPRPKVLEGDISAPDFGLSPAQIKWAAENCDTLLHNAASLSFVSTGRHSEPWLSNIDGTKHALEFCRQAGIKNLQHVSTAYICGTRKDRCFEHETNVGQEFGNCYEESKLEAEEMVRADKHLESLTVFRPGIIIGDSCTGMTTTFHNFYAALQLAYTLNNQLGQLDFSNKSVGMVDFNVDGSERKHLVTVDWVSAVMSYILTNPQHHGQTYHLTPRVPLTIRLMRDVIEQELKVYGVEFYCSGDRREMRTPQEDMFFKHMEVYNSYWRDDPGFDSMNTQKAAPHLLCPHIDRELLARLSQVAIKGRFSWKDPDVSLESLVPATVT